MSITPTVGRIVYYTPGELNGDVAMARNGDQSLAAIVTAVWSDTCVNLHIFDANGNSHIRTSVLLVQDDNPKPAGCFCEWMPYQLAQAAKAEAAEEPAK